MEYYKNNTFSGDDKKNKEDRFSEIVDFITDPVSPSCPICTSNNTITRYHEGNDSNAPFVRCFRYDKHFDHECRFCMYHWSSDLDIFTSKKPAIK